MKKIVFILTICLLAGLSSAAKLDDFESYTPGTNVNAGGTPWVMVPSFSTAAWFQEETSGNNYVAFWGANNGTRGIYRPLGDMSIAAGNTATTVFMRVLAETTNTDASFGLSDQAAPSVDGSGYPTFPSFEVQAALISGSIRARNAGVTNNLASISINTWYNIWFVINNSTDTYSLYMTTDQTSAVGTVPLAANYGFRNGTAANDLVAVLAIGATKVNPERVRIDDIYISSGENLSFPLIPVYAHNPTPASGQAGVETTASLSWYTGVDINNPEVPNPSITKHYVYMREGDPNLKYVTPTVVPAGSPVEATASCTPPVTLLLDKTYYWRVDESVNNSSPSDANTIQGDVWSFAMQKSIPIITSQPADTRVFPEGHPTADLNAVFNVTFTSYNTPTITWYKNDVAIVPNGGKWIVNNTSTSSQLVIDSPVLADEGKYYCVLSVPGSGSVTTVTCLLVIKQELAKFDFENNLDDTSGNGAPSGIMKTVSLADPNEFIATVVASPAYDSAGIDGSAIILDGTQFVDFGAGGYPKAGPLDTIGDIRGTAWYKKGFGRGMDEGSILCWVKLASDGVIYLNANNNSVAPGTDDTHFALSTNGIANARIIIRGENADTDGTAQNLAEASGSHQMDQLNLQDGKWHMFAATWDNSTARIYVNGEQVATNTQGYAEVYRAWERGNLLGTSRTLTRHILNANDFVTGSIDKLRVYNYVISATDIEAEYEAATGNSVCHNQNFEGVVANLDDTAGSYCVINMGDFLVIARNWLQNGF